MIKLANFGTNASVVLCNSWRDNISQVKESIPLVRCASGNVLLVSFSLLNTQVGSLLKIRFKLGKHLGQTGQKLGLAQLMERGEGGQAGWSEF